MPASSSRFGPYLVEEKLGSGTFGDVYRVRHAVSGQRRALKALKPELAWDPQFRARFLREARTATSLRHPHIVRVHEHDLEGASPFLLMDLFEPWTLADELATGTHLERPIEKWIAEVAEALDHAHSRRVIHRDVKPGNVLIDGTPGRALLSDFGMARVAQSLGLTQTGVAIGSFAYMSPEQCRGAVSTLDRRADVYSFSVMLFEIVTCQLPFGRGPAAIEGHLRRPPPSARRHNPWLTPELDAVLGRGLAKLPDDRYGTAGELADAFLRQFAGLKRATFGPALEVAGRRLPIAQPTCLVGRSPSGGDHGPYLDLAACDPDRTVSRRHAEIQVRDGRVRLRDAGSRNGTAVNGRSLQPVSEVLLDDGDRVRFGRVEATYLALAAR